MLIVIASLIALIMGLISQDAFMILIFLSLIEIMLEILVFVSLRE